MQSLVSLICYLGYLGFPILPPFPTENNITINCFFFLGIWFWFFLCANLGTSIQGASHVGLGPLQEAQSKKIYAGVLANLLLFTSHQHESPLAEFWNESYPLFNNSLEIFAEIIEEKTWELNEDHGHQHLLSNQFPLLPIEQSLHPITHPFQWLPRREILLAQEI